MANESNQLVVKVIGDTSQLAKDLAGAETQLKRFSSRTSTIKSTGADAFLASVRQSKGEAAQLSARLKDLEGQATATDSRMTRFGRGSLVAGIAVNTLGRNLAETGGEAGRFGKALSQLSTGNFVGFAQVARDNTDALKAFAAELVTSGDLAKAQQKANLFAAAGFDEVAKAARAAAGAIAAAQTAFSDPTKIHDRATGEEFAAPRGALPKRAKGRAGVSASLRNTFFDNDLARALDRVQDADLQGQVSKLKTIAGTIQKRIDATKDVTRRLTLEDELLSVNRQRKGVEEQIASEFAARISREKVAKQAAAAARSASLSARLFRELGLAADGNAVTPGVDNLRKRLGTFEGAVKGTFLDTNKTATQLARFRTVLSEALVPKDVRAKFSEMLDDLNQQLKDHVGEGPLTRTTGLNTSRVLAGLGLSPDQFREARSRLSGFNTAGIALAGSSSPTGGFVGGRPLVVQVQLDGRTVGQTVAPHVTVQQQKTRRRNPAQRRGPNRFDN